jgi:hypothetical protein
MGMIILLSSLHKGEASALRSVAGIYSLQSDDGYPAAGLALILGKPWQLIRHLRVQA